MLRVELFWLVLSLQDRRGDWQLSELQLPDMTTSFACRLTEGDSALEDEGKSKKASYLMPAMDFDEMRHETVLQEAEDMDLALQGKRVCPGPWPKDRRCTLLTKQSSLFP